MQGAPLGKCTAEEGSHWCWQGAAQQEAVGHCGWRFSAPAQQCDACTGWVDQWAWACIGPAESWRPAPIRGCLRQECTRQLANCRQRQRQRQRQQVRTSARHASKLASSTPAAVRRPMLWARAWAHCLRSPWGDCQRSPSAQPQPDAAQEATVIRSSAAVSPRAGPCLHQSRARVQRHRAFAA